MNRNGVFVNEKETLINIGLHIEAIDDDGNWCESEILNIIDKKIILKFLKHKEPCNRLFDISSNKWRLINNSQKTNNFVITNDDFKKGDCVLAKWHDGNYYLSQILDISSKTKFGTKVKEYHIVYLYDNVEETVSQNRLKSADSVDNKQNIEQNFKNNQILNSTNMVGKKPFRKRGLADNLESQKSSDNVFYDEKTKKFTENCKIRRLRLSQVNEKEKDNQDFELKDITIKLDRDDKLIENNLKLLDPPHIALPASNSNQKQNSRQRFSQRKRRSSFRKADYFYPDSIDHTVNDKNKSSNNVSQVSTPVNQETFEEISKSPRLSNLNILDQKDCVQSSNHSPISVSLTSTEESPKLKQKIETFNTELEIQDEEDQGMYSCNEEGQYLCLICTNKTFRKKKLVLEHIKYYHPNEGHQFTDNFMQPVAKVRYSPNKRYYSSYLKNNRSSLERKKHFSKLNKTKYKPYINRTLWSTRSNVIENSSEMQSLHQSNLQVPQIDLSDCRTSEKTSSINRLTNPAKKQLSSIIYCHRCKKSTEDGCLVQCDVCFCWSHTLCYGLSENKESNSFWECDNCANISSNDGKKTVEWHRDRWRFHSVPKNELPWIPKSASSKCQSTLKNICEMQSLLSLSQRILEAIVRHLDKLVFKGANDSNSQDDLDILKNLCVYDAMDEIPRLESLDVLNLNNDQEEIFKVSVADNPNSINCISTNKQSTLNIPAINSDFQFNEISFSNSTPIKAPVNGHKSINTSLDGILDCDIQKLDIIPKADFDALVKDLNSCEDIYKKNNCAHHSTKSSFLDLIADSCNITNPNKHVAIPASLSRSEMPFSQSTCLYQNTEIIEQPDGIIYLSSDEITNLLLEKETTKETSLCDDIIELSGHMDSTSKYQSRDSLLTSSNSDFEAKSIELIASTSSFDKINFRPSTNPTEKKQKPIQTDSKLEIEFNDLNAIIQPETANIIDPSTSSVFSDGDMRLSPIDSKCLHWLLCKFKCVEKIVESVEATMQSSDSSSDQSTNLESDYSRISKYLQSLLYILKKNQCQ